MVKKTFDITGMTCAACVARVEKTAAKLPGMHKAAVSLLTNTLEAEFDESALSTGEIAAAVRKAGYGATLREAGQERTAQSAGELAEQAQQQAKKRLIASCILLAVLMYIAMHHMLPAPALLHHLFGGAENSVVFAFTQFLLLLPILLLNRQYFTSGFSKLLHGAPNMDTLIAVGSGSALAYGVFAIFRMAWGLGHGNPALAEQYMHDLYFEAAGMILTLISLGKYLEARSRGKTTEAISKLMDLAPKTATLLRDGQEVEIPAEQIAVGDILVVRAGQSIPADGIIVEGHGAIDASALTGESVPEEKTVGDRVAAACVSRGGYFQMRAEKVGGDTAISGIIALVEQAAASKAPISKLADRIAGIFVPVVMGISAVTLAAWLISGSSFEFAFNCAIAVLVISCPCALGLATPVAIMAATGAGASRGILIKSAEAIEQLAKVDTVVLDKTGTLTEGRPQVTDVIAAPHWIAAMQAAPAGGTAEQPHPAFTGAAVQAASAESMPRQPHPAFTEAAVQTTPAESMPRQPYSTFTEAAVQAAPAGGTAEQPHPAFTEAVVQTAQKKLLEIAVALEKPSEHPLAEAILTCAAEQGVEAEAAQDFRTQPGRGISGKVGEMLCLGGNAAFLEENGVDTAPLREAAEQLAQQGKTPLYFAADGRAIGLIAAADLPKQTSREAIAALRKMGIRAIMLTGDNARTAEAVRAQLGIEQVIAEVLPEQKHAVIADLRAQGRVVAMVGDGINDAPALTEADVGLAVGAGTDIAIESAQVVLIKNDIRDCVSAIALGRKTMRIIKQNLFWAFFYNIIGIPVAAGVLYPAFGLKLSPMLGSAAMSFSSVFVVSNALRLRWREGRRKKQGDACGDKTCGQQTQSPAEIACGAVDGQQTQSSAEIACGNITKNHEKEKEKEGGSIMNKTVKVEGMMCQHCVAHVKKALEALKGVQTAEVSLEQKQAVLTCTEQVADAEIKAAIEEAGYTYLG